MNRAYFNGLKVVAKQRLGELFLDIFINAAVAFSLTTLRTGVTSVIRVLRTSDNEQRDFEAIEIINGTLENWVGVGNDGLVSVIYDQGLLGNHARQTDANKMARIVTNGVLETVNGLPVIDFSSGNWYVTDDPYPTTSGGTHIYVATPGSQNQRLLDTRGTGAAGTVKGWQQKTTNGIDVSIFDSGTELSAVMDIRGVTRSAQFMSSLNFTSNFLEEYTNDDVLPGGTDATSAPTDFNSGNPLYIGANVNGQNNQLYSGKLSEIILYNDNRASERIAMLQNRNEYYNIF